MGKKLVIAIVALVAVACVLVFSLVRARTSYDRSAEIDAIEGRPPAPNFFEPVDYVEWMTRQYAAGKPPGSSMAYARFWPDPMDADPGMPAPSKDVRGELLALGIGPEWTAADHPDVDEYLTRVAPDLDVFEGAVEDAPGFRLVPKRLKEEPQNPLSLLLPRISGSRHAIPCLLALAWREGEDHQARLLSAWRLGLVHARHLQESRQLILGRLGLEIRLAVYETMRAAASATALDQQGVSDALDLLGNIDPGPLDLREAIRIEWGGTLGTLQALYPSGFLNHELATTIAFVGGNSSGAVSAERLIATGITPAQLARATDTHYAQMLRIADGPVVFRTLLELGKLETENATGVLRGYPLRPLIQPSFRPVFREAFRCTATARATRLMLAVLLHSGINGQLPATLTEIWEDPEGRTDPGSETEFVYHVVASSSGNGFLLYSVGEDGMDDGGRHRPWADLDDRTFPINADFVFWPFRGSPK